jgi:hypothetical protein
MAARTSKSTLELLLRIARRTVEAIITRVLADGVAARDPLAELRHIGIDETTYKKAIATSRSWSITTPADCEGVSHCPPTNGRRLTTEGQSFRGRHPGRVIGCGPGRRAAGRPSSELPYSQRTATGSDGGEPERTAAPL